MSNRSFVFVRIVDDDYDLNDEDDHGVPITSMVSREKLQISF